MTRVCPTCKRPLPVDAEKAPHRPFCSPRCKMADLGSWLMGTYRISRPLDEQDLDEGIPRGAVGEPGADSGRLHDMQDPRRDGEDTPPPDSGGRGRGPRSRQTQGKSGGQRKSGTKIN